MSSIGKFAYLCKLSQADLKEHLYNKLSKQYTEVQKEDGFLFAKGDFPVLLVAHLDTVHKTLPAQVYWDKEKNAVHATEGIGGDDRCGVYMILEIIKHYNCSVLFTEDEEIGGIGADKFTQSAVIKTLDFNYIIELDRRGSNDAVFYDCANEDFTKFICQDFFKSAWGTFSDISVIAPYMGIAAVNLSCGYYNAHTANEYVVMHEMEKVIEETCNILKRTTETDIFEYIEAPRKSYSRYFYYGYDYDDDYYMIEYHSLTSKTYTEWECVCARSKDEALGKFVKLHPSVCYDNVVSVELYYDECEEKDDTKDDTLKANAPANTTTCKLCGLPISGDIYYTLDGKICKECYYQYYFEPRGEETRYAEMCGTC